MREKKLYITLIILCISFVCIGAIIRAAEENAILDNRFNIILRAFPAKDFYEVCYCQEVNFTISTNEEEEKIKRDIKFDFISNDEGLGSFVKTKGIGEGEVIVEYPVKYNDVDLQLVNEDEIIKKELEDFNMLYKKIDIHFPYLNSLKPKKRVNSEERKSLEYYLDKDDKNIKSIQEHYPNFLKDKEDIILRLDNFGIIDVMTIYSESSTDYFSARFGGNFSRDWY